jgi:hypothetical protein
MPPRAIKVIFGVWFGLDAVLALLPPLYWAAGDGSVEWSYLYFLGSAAVIVASVVAVYAVEAVRGELD